jgi:large conductance mechanosensitive channel
MNHVVNFLIVAFAIFILVKQLNRLKTVPPPPLLGPPSTKDCPYCLTTIPIKATRCGHCTSEVK